MKKTNILIIGTVFFMLIISGTSLETIDTTNTIIQEIAEPSHFEDATGMVIETSEINTVNTVMLSPSDVFTDFTVVPMPLENIFVIPPDTIADVDVWIPEVYPIDYFENLTAYFNYTLWLNYTLWPTAPNVYTDKETYCLYETVTYGIENTLKHNIGGISISIQKMIACNWENVVPTRYLLLLIEPDGIYESTWDQKGAYGMQVETGWYRIVIDYGYQGGSGPGYAYFTIDDCIHFVIPSYGFPVKVEYREYDDALPFVIPGFHVNVTYREYDDALPFIILP